MLNSIIDDIKYQFNTGNTVTRIIIFNVAIFVVAAILHAYLQTTSYWNPIIDNISLSANPKDFIYKPWTFVSHMFVHIGFFHVLWNLIGLFTFGRIVGDLLGDKKILPLYFISGLFGALVFIVSSLLLHRENSLAYGASAAVLGLAMVAATIAPDYIIRLLFLGDVKIKFIVAFFIFIDIIGIPQGDNTGGHFGHLGGMLGGFLVIFLYKKNYDIVSPLENLFSFLSGGYTRSKKPLSRERKYPSKLKVEHRSESLAKNQTRKNNDLAKESFQERLDNILDKISQQGYENLTKEEKEFLNNASKK